MQSLTKYLHSAGRSWAERAWQQCQPHFASLRAVCSDPHRRGLRDTLCVGVAVVIGFSGMVGYRFHHEAPSAVVATADAGAQAGDASFNFMTRQVLREEDIATYRAIFLAQRKAQWDVADGLLPHLQDTSLVGHVLAERYLDPRYTTAAEEAATWLKNYRDLPQSAAIYRLAEARDASVLRGIKPVKSAPSLAGFGDSNGLAGARDGRWREALSAYRAKDYARAADMYAELSESARSEWNRSAGAFWAGRAKQAAGDKVAARQYWEIAAEAPRTFYGILATRALGEHLDIQAQPPALTASQWSSLLASPALRRAKALSEVGNEHAAEAELRAYFPRTRGARKQELLAFAGALNLPAVQLRMGREMADAGLDSPDYALYPTPEWKSDEHYAIDPALVFALARKESGFHAEAKSHMGATGIMQLMPETANYMVKNGNARSLISALPDRDLARLTEPLYNVALGESYLAYLMRQPLVGNNLFYVAAAYNAGPGTLQTWLAEDRAATQDPLLFVESIPYSETRNYVMQVMTNYWMYSAMLHSKPLDPARVLSGEWPRYRGHSSALARSIAPAPARRSAEMADAGRASSSRTAAPLARLQP